MISAVNPNNFKFCPRCGHPLVTKFITQEKTQRLVCEQCNFIFYINPIPAVAAIVMKDNHILLVKRKYDPRKDMWSLPAGFMEFGETAEGTAIRETKEETNLDIQVDELFGVFPGFDDPRVHVVLIVFRTKILNGHPVPGDDASDVRFFPLDRLPEEIAFASHRQVLNLLVQEKMEGLVRHPSDEGNL